MKTTVKIIAAIAAMNASGFTIDAQTLQPVTSGYAVADLDVFQAVLYLTYVVLAIRAVAVSFS